MDLVAVAGADAGALLPAVLQGVEAEVGQLGGFGMAVDGDHAALVVEFIEHGQRPIAVRAFADSSAPRKRLAAPRFPNCPA